MKTLLCLIQAKEKPGSVVHADDPISFLQLSSRGAGDLGGTENVFELSLNQAVVGRRDGISSGLGGGESTPGLSKLNKVTQLTGFSDPVYAEAYVHVNQYDIVLDVLIVNQTGMKVTV
jgi:coatomer subunit beta